MTQNRHQYWVDAPLQIQMVGFVVLMISTTLLLTAFSVFRGVQEASTSSRQIFHSIEWIKAALRAPLLLASTISLAVGALVTLCWSRRFAGPLRKMIEADRARIAEAMARLEEAEGTLPAGHSAKDSIAQALDELRSACAKYHL